MKILVSHPTGNANVRMVVTSISENGMLGEFHTTVAVNRENKLTKLLPLPIRKELLRRSYKIDSGIIRMHPFFELGRIITSRLKLNYFIRHEKGVFSVDAVYRNFDQAIASGLAKSVRISGISAVYAYEDGALATFKKAKEQNLKTLYDLPIGYWRSARTLLAQELETWPEWAVTLKGFSDSTVKLESKDAELALADHIFVASTFTKNSLKSYSGTLPPVTVVPYGFPPVVENRVYEPLTNRPLKLLFVGGLSQRKGIANILAAIKPLENKVQLTIIGKKPVENCVPLNDALERYRYIPSLPHEEILNEMKAHDLLLFPSLFEGFGLVITEAMSQGTPVITTDRTCGPDLIRHGENGWLVPAGDTKTLHKQILELIKNPHLLESAGKEALRTAAKRPWKVYGEELMKSLKKMSS